MERIDTIRRHVADAKLAVNQTSGHVATHDSSELFYTKHGNVLTKQERQYFDNNGFLLVKKLIPEEELTKYKDRFLQICEGEVQVPGCTIMKDIAYAKANHMPPEKAVNKIQDFHSDDVMFSYCQHPEVLRYVNDIVGENTMGIHTMLINKPPDKGSNSSRHPMHQDLHYFPIRPAHRIVASWTAMEKINRKNGCLVVLPGSHKGPLLSHGYPEWEGGVNKMYHGITDYYPKSGDRLFLDMEAGDTVFFHPCLIHGSGANKTDRFRKAISCHYAASECEFVDTAGTTQEVIAKEVLDIARRKMKNRLGDVVNDLKYEDVWRFKSRVTSGERINI